MDAFRVFLFDCDMIGELMGHSKPVDAVAVKASLAVTAGEDCVLCLHGQEGSTWTFLKSINLKKTIYSVEMSEDGMLLVQTLGNKMIKMDREGRVLEEMDLGSERVSSKSGNVKVLESDGSIVLEDGRRYEAHQHGINGLVLIKDVIYTWSFDGSIVEYCGGQLTFQKKYMVSGANCVIKYGGRAAVLTHDGRLVDLHGNELLRDARLRGGCQGWSNHEDSSCIINASNSFLRVTASVNETKGQFVAIGGGFIADKDKGVHAIIMAVLAVSCLHTHLAHPLALLSLLTSSMLPSEMINAGSRCTLPPSHTSRSTIGSIMLPR